MIYLVNPIKKKLLKKILTSNIRIINKKNHMKTKKEEIVVHHNLLEIKIKVIIIILMKKDTKNIRMTINILLIQVIRKMKNQKSKKNKKSHNLQVKLQLKNMNQLLLQR
jgi:hypothetical protein